MINTPYVKQYDSKGVITNPIEKEYKSFFPNRATRRKKEGRFYGESKNLHLTVTPTAKFLRLKQIEVNKKGKRIVIEHYIELKRKF